MSMGKFLFAAICNSNGANTNFPSSGVLFGKPQLHVAEIDELISTPGVQPPSPLGLS